MHLQIRLETVNEKYLGITTEANSSVRCPPQDVPARDLGGLPTSGTMSAMTNIVQSEIIRSMRPGPEALSCDIDQLTEIHFCLASRVSLRALGEQLKTIWTGASISGSEPQWHQLSARSPWHLWEQRGVNCSPPMREVLASGPSADLYTGRDKWLSKRYGSRGWTGAEVRSVNINHNMCLCLCVFCNKRSTGTSGQNVHLQNHKCKRLHGVVWQLMFLLVLWCIIKF